MDFNPADLMNNIKGMQSQMKDMQEKLKNVEVEGSSGGGLVKVIMNGEMKVVSIKLDPIAVDPRDIDMLQDLIIAAMNSAQDKVKEKIESEVKLPFNLNGFK